MQHDDEVERHGNSDARRDAGKSITSAEIGAGSDECSIGPLSPSPLKHRSHRLAYGVADLVAGAEEQRGQEYLERENHRGPSRPQQEPDKFRTEYDQHGAGR